MKPRLSPNFRPSTLQESPVYNQASLMGTKATAGQIGGLEKYGMASPCPGLCEGGWSSSCEGNIETEASVRGQA